MHTEAEASKLQCAINQKAWTTCIASKCAMWRWGWKPNPDYHPTEMFNGLIQNRVEPYVADTERGYCGLAGRPL